MAAVALLTFGGLSRRMRVNIVRGLLLATLAGAWELVSRSGLVFQDVVPSIPHIAKELMRLIVSADFYQNLAVTGTETFAAVIIGGAAGLVVGILLGGSAFLSKAYEPYLYYLGPTPKIVLFPILIMLFGTDMGSKTAMGAISCFFPVALSVAAGMREVAPVLIRVARSFRATALQQLLKVYLPAMSAPILNGFRMGFGVALIGVLLAETKLSSSGIGFSIIQSYIQFQIAKLYALLILMFAIAIAVNSLLTAVARPR
jgi:ABC-type nitrate/sulfonate/bicarbonate transport system permease component